MPTEHDKYVRIITTDNPFRKSAKKTSVITLTADKLIIKLSDIIQDLPADYTTRLNGRIITEEDLKNVTLNGGELINRIRKINGDSGSQTVASALLMVAAIATGGIIAAGAAWGMASYLASSAILYVGGWIVNKFATKSSTSNTVANNYSWDTPKPNYTQGAAVAITWGTVRVKAPQVLSVSATSSGTDSYLNYILSGGEGPLDSIANIQINSVDIADYADVTLEQRLGTNNQTALTIPTLFEASSTVTLSYLLSSTAQSASTDNNQTKAIEIALYASSGLYAVRNSRTSSGLTAVPTGAATILPVRRLITVNYRITGTSTWTTETYYLQGSEQTALRDKHKISGLTAGKYDVQITAGDPQIYITWNVYYVNGSLNASHTTWVDMQSGSIADTFVGSSNVSSAVYWEGLISYYGIKPIRPNKALVGFAIKATDQLSGSEPTITWTQTRSTVHVWNPNTTAYEEHAATNPWWAAYDLLHYCRKIKNISTGLYDYIVYGAPAESLIYSEFKTCADYADTIGLTFNFFLNENTTLSDALQYMATVGRGAIVLKGSQFGCTCDMPKEVVQIFNVANIKSGSFKETFIPAANRANAVEITYTDKDNSWEQTNLPVYSTDWDDTGITSNPTQITVQGITDRALAYRHGKYYLRCNKYINRQVEFKADIDSISCDIGDLIIVQHDLPAWGSGGGRILAQSAGNQIKLDKKVIFESGSTYSIIIRHSEGDSEGKEILTTYIATPTNAGATKTDEITLSASTTNAIIPYDDIYIFGVNTIVAKPFVIQSIDKSEALERVITAQEYSEAIYDETGTVPEINYTALRVIAEVENLFGKINCTVSADGSATLNLTASWTLPVSRGEIIKSFVISYSIDGGDTWIKASETTATNYKIDPARPLNYYIKVQTKNNTGIVSAGVNILITYDESLFATPPNPTLLVASLMAPNEYVILHVYYPGQAGIYKFMYRYIAGNTANWGAGVPINDAGWPDTAKAYLPDGQYCIMARAITSIGIMSNYVSTVITIVNNIGNIIHAENCADGWENYSGSYLGVVEDGEFKAIELSSGNYQTLSYNIVLNTANLGNKPGKLYMIPKITGNVSYISWAYNSNGIKQWYTEPIDYDGSEGVNIEIEIYAGTARGVIESLKFYLSGPTTTETHASQSIASTGGSVAPTFAYTSISVNSITVHTDSTHTASSVVITALTPAAGASLQGYAPDGTPAAALVDISYTGY